MKLPNRVHASHRVPDAPITASHPLGGDAVGTRTKNHLPRPAKTSRPKTTLPGIAATIAAALVLAGCTVDQWIATYWPGDEPNQQKASDIFWCESRHQWDAVSPDGRNHGVPQINTIHRATFEAVTGQPWSEVYGPHAIQYARWLWERQGWTPWTCAR